MPTTKDRTPAAWRSHVPPEVRWLAAVAADLRGVIGTKGKARGPYRQGTHSKARRSHRSGSARDDSPQPDGADPVRHTLS